MACDPLATLARLRKLETDLARQRLAEGMARVAAAEGRAREASGALESEQDAAGVPADYAAWVARGLAERDRAARALALTEARAAEARSGLVAARTAERALEVLRDHRAEAAARHAARRASALLDDFAARRR